MRFWRCSEVLCPIPPKANPRSSQDSGSRYRRKTTVCSLCGRNDHPLSTRTMAHFAELEQDGFYGLGDLVPYDWPSSKRKALETSGNRMGQSVGLTHFPQISERKN